MAKHLNNMKIEPSTVRSYVEENFSVERMVKNYVALYQEILSGTQTRRAA
jgi:hypothetical protein